MIRLFAYTVTMFGAVFALSAPAHADVSAQCKADYQKVFDTLNRTDGPKVPDSAISFALKVEKVVNAGGSTCPEMDEETRTFLRGGITEAESKAISQKVIGRGLDRLELVAEGRQAIAGKDQSLARRKFLAACDVDSGEGCALAGAMVAQGKGGAQDTQRGIALFRKACSLDYAGACEVIENATADTKRQRETNDAKIAQVQGFLEKGDTAGAEAILKETCDASYARGCGLYALFLEGIVKSTDTARITAVRKKACGLGDKPSCN